MRAWQASTKTPCATTCGSTSMRSKTTQPWLGFACPSPCATGSTSPNNSRWRAALQAIRDRDTQRILSGSATLGRFHDISAINSALGEERATHDLFTQIDAQLPELAKDCAELALPALVAVEDFQLARRYLPDPVARITAQAKRVNDFAEDLAKRGNTSSAPQLLAFVLNYTKEVRLVVEVFRRLGEDEEVANASAAALDSLKSEALRDAVQREFDNPGSTIAAMVAHAKGSDDKQ